MRWGNGTGISRARQTESILVASWRRPRLCHALRECHEFLKIGDRASLSTSSNSSVSWNSWRLRQHLHRALCLVGDQDEGVAGCGVGAAEDVEDAHLIFPRSLRSRAVKGISARGGASPKTSDTCACGPGPKGQISPASCGECQSTGTCQTPPHRRAHYRFSANA